MSSCEDGQVLGGFGDILSSVVSLPTVLAMFAVFLSAMQGMIALESTDPCRISARKMNILLGLEVAEVVVSVTSELLSFFELRSALQSALTWLHWVAPCLLAAGVLETMADVYFTLAVVTKSRIGWIPFSASGSSDNVWEVLPFSITFAFSFCLVGWRMHWWWKAACVSADQALSAAQNETALQKGVMGFAVGWTVGVSALVFIIIMLTDLGEDGANYLASLPYLWRPDEWIYDRHGDVKIWYRNTGGKEVLQQYAATAVLDESVEVPETERDVLVSLGRKPLHCGNAIVGKDRELLFDEDRKSSRLHKIMIIAEHLVVLPLLIVVVVIVVRMHDTLDEDTFNAVRQLADGVVVLAFLEIAIGVKNVLWSISGTSKEERPSSADEKQLQELQGFYGKHFLGTQPLLTEQDSSQGEEA